MCVPSRYASSHPQPWGAGPTPLELAVPKGIVSGLSGLMVLGATSRNPLGLFPALPSQAFGRQGNKSWGSRPSPSGDWLKGLCQCSGSGTSCWRQGRKCVSVHACVCGLSVSVGRQAGLGVGRSGKGEIPQPPPLMSQHATDTHTLGTGVSPPSAFAEAGGGAVWSTAQEELKVAENILFESNELPYLTPAALAPPTPSLQASIPNTCL